MLTALMIFTALLIAVTALPLLRAEVWWVRALEFPRLQIAAAILLLLLLDVWFFDSLRPWGWWLSGAALACLAWQVWWLRPYTRLHRIEVKSASSAATDRRLRLLSANVLGSNRRADAFLELVRDNDPDIVLTLESNAWSQERLDVLENSYPHTIKCALENLYGMHVYSRLPLSETRIEYLVLDGVPSMHACITLRSGDEVRAHFLHPAPPSPTEAKTSSERDAELVIVARSVADGNAPVIVAGDLNDVAWSSTTRLFRKISRLLDPRVGRGMYNSFNANYPFLRWPLDHIFHSAHFRLCKLRLLPPFGSDHFALLTELEFVGGDQAAQLRRSLMETNGPALTPRLVTKTWVPAMFRSLATSHVILPRAIKSRDEWLQPNQPHSFLGSIYSIHAFGALNQNPSNLLSCSANLTSPWMQLCPASTSG